VTSELQYDLAKRAFFMQVAQCLWRLLEGVSPLDDRRDHAAGDELHDLIPGLDLHGGCLGHERESGHAGALPDKVGHVDCRST